MVIPPFIVRATIGCFMVNHPVVIVTSRISDIASMMVMADNSHLDYDIKLWLSIRVGVVPMLDMYHVVYTALALRFYLKIWLSSSLSICHICTCNMLILLCILHIILNGPTLCLGNKVEDKILKVGEELWRETLPLQGGSCFYQLQGLKPHTWYEVKISYPASIPASFSIQLKRNKSDVVLNNNRRLLNTEKLIFKTNSNQDEFLLVLVTVEPEGFPAKLHVAERQFIIFNIVCDELLLGIPHKAWWVVALALLCLGIAFIVPSFLPLHLLPKNQVLRTDDYVSKIS
ncbi:hypothetical protein HKD37_19G054934 [Glycine soja]